MEAQQVYRLPMGLKDWPDSHGMTNCDYSIEEWFEQFLRDGGTGNYTAWNFCGYVWFSDGKYHCEIWQYRHFKETVTADTLPEIMKMASDKYGYE